MDKLCIINGRFLTQKITGVQRYANELLKAIDKILDEDNKKYKNIKFVLVAPNKTNNHVFLRNIQIIHFGNWSGHIWEQIQLPFYSRGKLLINLCNSGPLMKIKQIVTVHDTGVCVVKNAYSFPFRMWYRLLFSVLSKTAKRIITVSFFSKSELIKFFHVGGKKIRVTYEAGEHALIHDNNLNVLKKFNLTKEKYIFVVSSMSPHKNFKSVVNAIKYLEDVEFDIVIAGGTNPKVFKKNYEFPSNIKYIGYITDDEMKILYKNAACFIYPSLYEGFGLPPLEAMVNGCPVIVSNVASLPEICENAALYCDPNDSKDIANKIKQVMLDEKLRKDLMNRGLEQSKKFSWEKCARETLSIIEEVLK